MLPGSQPDLAAQLAGSLTPQGGKKRLAKFLNAKDKEDPRAADRQKLLQSLNDLGEQLTRPSIEVQKEPPMWLQATIKEEAAKMGLSQANLGKPSSRQDAILLAKWFKGTIDMIETEYQ